MKIGCGPGFFTIDMAEMVGESGRVIASDLQAGMLVKVKNKIRGTKVEERIILHKSEETIKNMLKESDILNQKWKTSVKAVTHSGGQKDNLRWSVNIL